MKKNETLVNIGLAIVSLILTFIAIELVFRCEHKIYKISRSTHSYCMGYDKELIYRGLANKCNNNSHGYRDYEYSYAKTPGTYRILLIGDSIAFGQGVKLGDSFSKVLESKLNTPAQSKKFEVILLAQSGYSTSQELRVLKKEAFLYHPDAILWSYCLNDPADPVFHNQNGELGRYFYNSNCYVLDFIRKRIFLFAESKKSSKCQSKYYDSLLHCVYWDKVERDIKEIGKISRQSKIQVFFLIHPDLFEGIKFSEYPIRGLHKRLFTLASSSGLIPVDLFDCYKKYDFTRIKSELGPWHLDTQGHLAVANYLYAFLQSYWRGESMRQN